MSDSNKKPTSELNTFFSDLVALPDNGTVKNVVKQKARSSKLTASFEAGCIKLVDTFIESLNLDKEPSFYWIGNIGGVFHLNDRYYNVNSVIDYFNYDLTEEELYEWYDQDVPDDDIDNFIEIPQFITKFRNKT